ncbi:MAG: glycosyltransferase [Bacteroidetes bacterium]|nr:glycosyltransferase [Bacteroidota bacterium]
MMLTVYITAGLVLLYGLLLGYYYAGWKQLPSFDSNPEKHFTPTLRFSIIVPARNEATRIAGCIQSLIGQDYPAHLLEIIVVNDDSTDNTEEVVRQTGGDRVRILTMQYREGERVTAPKKRAIEAGIAAATGDWIVTTDADCTALPGWISRLADYQQQQQPLFIAAPVSIASDGPMLSKFQSLDFLTMQGITGASVYKRLHNMCNGANLAYDKKTFYEVNGFAGIDNIASGDDMLLMHKIATRYPQRTGFIKSRQAIIVTEPAHSWREFFQQRIRWASKAMHYKSPELFLALLLVYLANLAMLVTLLLAFFYPAAALAFLSLWIVKFALEFFFVREVAVFFNQQKLLPYLFLLQPLHIAYIVVSGFFGQFKSYQWKGRTLK